MIEKKLIERESLRRQNEVKNFQQDRRKNAEAFEDNFEVYRKLHKMGLDQINLRQIMMSDGCTTEVTENFLQDCYPSPKNTLLFGFSIQTQKIMSDRSVYILQNSANQSYFRVERYGKKILVMTADRIFFSSDKIVRVIVELPQMQIKQWHGTLYSIFLGSTEHIDVFDNAFAILEKENLHPFPDYIMHDLETATRPKEQIFCQLASETTLMDFSCGNPRKKIRVGIIDNFNTSDSCPHPHGIQCRQVIEIFESSNQSNSGENFTSNITFCEYNFLGKIAEMEKSGKMEDCHQFRYIDTDNFCAQQTDAVSQPQSSGLSILFEYLNAAAADKLDILNMSIVWSPELQNSMFERIISEFRKYFDKIIATNCVCILAAGNESYNLDADIECCEMDTLSNRWITRSLFPCVANNKEHMIVVGASGVFGQYCSFSNYGSQIVRFAGC